jgi:hypothetical protein
MGDFASDQPIPQARLGQAEIGDGSGAEVDFDDAKARRTESLRDVTPELNPAFPTATTHSINDSMPAAW